jgi:serine/threonine-protein kinase
MTASGRDLLGALNPLLEDALDIAPGERAAWLDSLRASRPEIAAELEALLAVEGELDSRGFLGAQTRARLAPSASPLAGLRLGAYTLERPLGRGGMGSVWLAARSDGRYEGKAAVKLLNLALLDPVGIERFRREGNALARLTHPNIARLTDAGISESGQPFLVLEHVAGRRIDQYCDEERLGPGQRIGIFLQVLAAVGHAHANLIVHRDLKPSNILVTDDGTVKLLDFGIAKLLEAEAVPAERSELTDLGGAVLTPEYAAPEQASGGSVTTATDVYSLGVLLYVLLAARHPTGEGCRTAAEHLRGILDTEPPRLSSVVAAPRGLKRLGRVDRGDLDNIVAKALKKAPAQRYPTVAAFADDLGRHLRHEPVLARADSFGYRARRFVRRNRWAVLAGGMMAIALVLATAVTTGQMVEARRQRDEALFQARRAKAQVEFQTLLLSSLGETPLTSREILDRGWELLQREWVGEPRFASSIMLTMASHYQTLGDHAKEAELLIKAESLALAAGAVDMVVPVRCARADNIHMRDSTVRALALLDSTRPLFSQAARSDVAGCLLVEAAMAYHTNRDRADTAVILGRRALGLLDSLGDTTGMQYIGALNIVANALENAGRGREAIAAYEHINDVLERSGRLQSVTHNVIRNNIGIALSNLGEMRAAEPVLRRTVEEFERSDTTGFVHPAIVINYARTLLFLRKLDSAAVWYGHLASVAADQGQVEMQQTGHYGLALVEAMRGRLPQAARHAAETKRLGAVLEQPRLTDDLVLAGVIASAGGDAPAGLANLESALRRRGYDEGKRPYLARAELVFASEAALLVGNSAKAIEYARAARGIADVDSLTDTRSAYVGEASLLEARGLLAAGDTAGARDRAAQALTALTNGAGADDPRAVEARALLDGFDR